MSHLQKLQHKMSTWYRHLERPGVAAKVVIALLFIHSSLLAYSAYVHSPTLNEPAHLVAGLSHWKFNRFELYRVNPPLVRMVAALPVMAAGYEEDWSGFYDRPGARPVFKIGEDFIVANGERSYFLFMIARWACIPFSWLGAIVCYLWARDLSGKLAGLIACTLWCFSPNILAHASLITADAHATALGLAACYTFWRWLKKPTWTQAAITGSVLGLAELAKTTLILFYPLWPLLWLVYRWSDRKQLRVLDWLREAAMLLLRMAIGLLVLNMGYDFEGSFKSLKDFHFTSNLFTGQADTAGSPVATHPLAASGSPYNRFAGILLGYVPVPFPENYLLGIDVQQSDFEDFHSPSYLRGQFQEHGWWHYYLYAVAIKVPLGTWGLAIMFLVLRSIYPLSNSSCRNQLILLAPALIVFIVVSSKTGFSHHSRYVLPCFPFVIVWISQITRFFSASAVMTSPDDQQPSVLASAQDNLAVSMQKFAFLPSALTCLFLAWSVGSSLLVYPHSISYFNELTGGPAGGADHLINSNIDWGQDLRYLKWWREEHKDELQGQPFYLAYDGFLSPAELGFADALPWPTNQQNTDSDLNSGHYAISVNLLRGGASVARDGGASQVHLQQPMLKHFRTWEPCGRAGYSILIYQINSERANLVRSELD